MIGDVWAAYGRTKCPTADAVICPHEGSDNYYWFYDLHKLTMFADYRVPQILRSVGVLEYSTELSEKIDNYVEIIHGSLEEVELRACTIIAVEKLKEVCNRIIVEKELSFE